ncbi:MAG TPA: peptidylprolyl isomerase [Acidimicrobiales bacterium]|nr:peptidylprolyl isomerase [Acidimicrobiales bacterium]
MVTQNQKRARQKQGRQARQEALDAARRKRARRNRAITAIALTLALVGGIGFFVGGGGKTKAAPKQAACPAADGSSPRQTKFSSAPPICIDPTHTYTAQITTNQGVIDVSLDQKQAPNTVNSFVFLARYHFFDGLTFHRVAPGFVIQGGDPEGTGAGGPGYKFGDELPKAGQYKIGSLAMANAGPDTNGSQFFIISGDQGAKLDPKYSLFGQVTNGLDVVAKIDALGNPDDQSGKPTQPITMSSVTIKES